MRKEIEGVLDEISGLCRTHGVRRLALFGSASRADFDPDTSDVDLLVEFGEMPPTTRARCYFDLLEALEVLLGRAVDLVEPGAVRNPFIRKEIDASRVVLYEAA